MNSLLILSCLCGFAYVVSLFNGKPDDTMLVLTAMLLLADLLRSEIRKLGKGGEWWGRVMG